jgi:hypothetical protein
MPKSRTKVPRTMAPAWRRILMKHQGAVLGEFRRDPKIEEKISGIVLAFSDEFLLLRRMHWDTFSFSGYTIIRDSDITYQRFFTKASDWRRRALTKIKSQGGQWPHLNLDSWQAIIVSVAASFPVLTIHPEIADPDVCYIGYPLKVGRKKLVLDDLDCNSKWSGPRKIRIDLDGGYERALAGTAPARNHEIIALDTAKK